MLEKTDDKLPLKEEVIDLGKYLSTLKKYWLSIFLFTTLTTAITVLMVLSITPVYRTTAVLLIEAQQQRAVSIEEIVGIDTSQKEYYLTQFEILKSNQIAERVIDKLNLATLPEFNGQREKSGVLENIKTQIKSLSLIQAYLPEEQPATEEQLQEALRQRVLTTFKRKLTISPVRNTQLVNISFESEDRKLAARIANEVGNSYIESNLEARLTMTTQASGWLSGRLNELKQQLLHSEDQLSDFLQQEGLIDLSGIDGIDGLASTELSDLTNGLSAARDRRIAAESLSYLLKTSKNADLSSLSSVTEISNHPQMRDIRLAEIEVQTRVSELSNRYGPKHDKMIQVQAQLKTVQDSARNLLAQLVKGLDKERQAARQQEASLQQALTAKKIEYQHLTVKEAKYDALKREVDSNRQLYDLFLNRQKETSATSDFKSANARFSDYAMTPMKPAKPQKTKIVGIAAVAGMMLAIILVFILESLRSTIEHAEDIEDKLGLYTLGAIPSVKSKRFRNKALDASLFFDSEQRLFTESIRSIRTTLLLNLVNQTRKRIAVTSSLPGEGKTTTAINLAVAMASMEKVLLIDCDLRRPSVGERFGMAKSHPGVSNMLVMGATIDECIYHDDQSDLDVLPAGLLPPNPLELLSSKKLVALLTQLEEQYDRIVIDTPPALIFSDALVAGRIASATIIVVKAGTTRLKQINATISKLIKHDIAIDGVIINQVNAKNAKHEYGYSSYDDYY
ncbi:polysaccharide biosynthesis tyrosine autokinase [Photobacterium sagamiensis]|uniref:GumC family protein n=1 Tax=Photobacterium sagamiensis TaxID=2910241 RepID=UPI003D13484F